MFGFWKKITDAFRGHIDDKAAQERARDAATQRQRLEEAEKNLDQAFRENKESHDRLREAIRKDLVH